MKKIIIASFAVAATGFSGLSWAQSGQAWRCPGNHYTNSAAEAKKIGGCTPLEGNITVIGAGSSPAPSRATPPSRGTSTPQRGSGDLVVKPDVQTDRNAQARRLVESELRNKQAELEMLQRQYNNGEPERFLSERDNDALYEERADRMSREIAKTVAQIVEIQNELDRMK